MDVKEFQVFQFLLFKTFFIICLRFLNIYVYQYYMVLCWHFSLNQRIAQSYLNLAFK